MIGILLIAFLLAPGPGIPAPAAENPFAVNEEIRQFLDKNINRGTDSLQQLQTLVHLVFEKNTLHFTYQPVTRTAVETFENQGGNCVSFTFLLIAMARYLGMSASFREVDFDPIWSEIGSIPSLDGHADVAVRIGAQEYDVDLFPVIYGIHLSGRTVSDQRALAHFWNNRGAEKLGKGQAREAILCFDEALQSDPTAAFVWENIGVAESIQGRYEDAVQSYKRALRSNKSDPIAMSNLALAYDRMGQPSEALHYQDKVQRFNQKNPYYHFRLGLQDYGAGRYSQSLDQLRTALKLKSTELNFYVVMANDYLRLGDVKKARQSIESGLHHVPDDAVAEVYRQKLERLNSR